MCGIPLAFKNLVVEEKEGQIPLSMRAEFERISESPLRTFTLFSKSSNIDKGHLFKLICLTLRGECTKKRPTIIVVQKKNC
jgi:hypothetical protein